MIKNANRARNATKQYDGGSALAVINRQRQIGAAFNALKDTEQSKALLVANDYRLPTTTLGDYQQRTEAALAAIDAGGEPYLVNSEALSFGMHPLIEVWDVGVKTTKAARGGKSRVSQEMVMVCTQRGDALLPPDTLLVWR